MAVLKKDALSVRPFVLFLYLFHGCLTAAAATGSVQIFRICLGGTAGIGLRSLRCCLIGQAADPNQAVSLFGKLDSDQEFAMLGAGGQVHVPVTGLRKPAGAQHSGTAGGADILLAGHGMERCALIRKIMIDLTADATGQLCTVEAVFVAL